MADKTIREVADKGKDTASNILAMKDLQIIKWQRISFGLLIVTLLSVIGVLFVSTRATFIPYMISVDEHTGRVQSLGALTEIKREPTDAEIAFFLSRFVEQIRSIPADQDILKENVNRATTLLTEESASKFKNLYLPDLVKKIESGSKNRVRVLSVTPIDNKAKSYQVRWEESSVIANGAKPLVHSFTSTFNVEKKEVDSKEMLTTNPLGLFITDFTISDEGEKK